MPSLSVAICEIGRIVADWAISISDLGFLCWSSPRATPFLLAACCRVLALRGQPTQPSSTRRKGYAHEHGRRPYATPPITYTPRPGWTNAQGQYCREYKSAQDADRSGTE